MEQTALRPRPMPGQDPGGTGAGGTGGTGGPGAGAGGPGPRRRPHAVRRRGRRPAGLLCAVLAGTVLLLSGVGLGAVGAAVLGTGRLADLQRQAVRPDVASPSARPGATPSSPPPAPVRATLGVEVADAGKPGALVVGVHVPGPGFSAGLVRGDVLLVFGRTRVDSAADLARAVAAARPGTPVTLTVRHRSGGYQQITAVPGILT
ncbi:PDZ domain-containing protein [Streptomyces sp. NPDC085946]|uniref:PDZ domain-containing protein n=1 Tax=Streptomyces sp. NPDC085946 TaxID=3365744 RepID=UPI0037D20B38